MPEKSNTKKNELRESPMDRLARLLWEQHEFAAGVGVGLAVAAFVFVVLHVHIVFN